MPEVKINFFPPRLQVLWYSFYKWSNAPYDKNINSLELNSKLYYYPFKRLFNINLNIKRKNMGMDIIWHKKCREIRVWLKAARVIPYDGKFIKITFPNETNDIKYFEYMYGRPFNGNYSHFVIKDFHSERIILKSKK